MAIRILAELLAEEKVVVQTLRIDVLKAETALNQTKTRIETEFQQFKAKADADIKAAQDYLQNKGAALMTKLREVAAELKLDINTAQFDMDKLYFFVNVEVSDLKDAVKKAVQATEAEAKTIEGVLVDEAKHVDATVTAEAVRLEGEIKKVL